MNKQTSYQDGGQARARLRSSSTASHTCAWLRLPQTLATWFGIDSWRRRRATRIAWRIRRRLQVKDAVNESIRR